MRESRPGPLLHSLTVVALPRQTTEPLLAVELDDRLHRRPNRRSLDRFKDDVLAAAGVPVYRIPARQAYDPLELAAEIGRLVGGHLAGVARTTA